MENDGVSLPPAFNRFERYRAHDGMVERCRIAYTDARNVMAGARVHFKENFFLCKEGQCCTVLGPPKWRVCTVLIKYLRKSFFPDPDSYELYPWIFGRKTYMSLNELDIKDKDFNIHCEHEQYQMIHLEPCLSSWKGQLRIPKEKIVELFEYGKQSLGCDLSEEEINTLLQGTEPVAPVRNRPLFTSRLTTPPPEPITPPELISIVPIIPVPDRIGKRKIIWQ